MRFLAVVCVIFFCGCASLYTRPSGFITEVITDPPGADIEVDGEYFGKAPLTIDWGGYNNRTFAGFHKIVANPSVGGHCVQNKTYSDTSEIPHRVFFSMRLCRESPLIIL